MKFEIRDTKRKNLENKILTILDILNLYIKYLIVFPMKKNLRDQLLNATYGFFEHMKNEDLILKRLDKACISYEAYINILNELDVIYELAYEYYDHILGEFETTLSLRDFERIVYKDKGARFLTHEKTLDFLEKIDELELNIDRREL